MDVYYELYLPTFDTLMSNARFRPCSRRLKLCENNALLSSLFCIYPFNLYCKLLANYRLTFEIKD